MSDFQFFIQGFSTGETDFQLLSRDFELVIDNPSLLLKTYKGDDPIEFVLSKYAQTLSFLAHLAAKKIGLKTNPIKVEVYGQINPELLLSNSYADLSKNKNLMIDILSARPLPMNKLDQWRVEIRELCLTHPKMQYILPNDIIIRNSKKHLVSY